MYIAKWLYSQIDWVNKWKCEWINEYTNGTVKGWMWVQIYKSELWMNKKIQRERWVCKQNSEWEQKLKRYRVNEYTNEN